MVSIGNDVNGAEVAGVLPLSEDIVSNASGGLFSVTNPGHVWSQTVTQVAALIGR